MCMEIAQTSRRVVSLGEKSFEGEVLRSTVPVFVDFYADWCGPCKAVEPTIEALAGEYEGKIKFVKVNVDENQKIAMRYDIMSIPTAVLFENGEVKDSLVGAFPAATYRSRLDSALHA